ncbi:MAG: carboxypeptidase regulatory-like domain-containing protein, partial [Candidatus Binataceae bacterium]
SARPPRPQPAPPQPPATVSQSQPATGQAQVPPALSAKGRGEITGTVTIRGKVEPAVKDAVLWVAGVPRQLIPKERLKPGVAAMEQKDIAFVPHVLPVLVGTTVNFPNDDPVFHNVYSASPVHKFDLGLYPQGRSRSTQFDQPGIAHIGCNVHAQMSGYVVVLAEPFFAVPNERGVYQLGGLPLGTYTIKLWDPDFAPVSQPFTLTRDGEVLNLDFDLGEEK